MTKRCPVCHQPVRHAIRCGAALTPLKTRIYDLIKRAGAVGISTEAVLTRLGREIKSSSLKSHIWQINQMIEDGDMAIRSHGRHWRLTPRLTRSNRPRF